MKYLSFILFICFALSCNNSKRGSGNIIKEPRTVQTFDAINASGAVEVDVQIGTSASVIVETDDNIMPFVETDVSGGTLTIKLKGLNNLRNSTVYVHIVAPAIRSLKTAASAEIKSKDIIKASEKMVLKASSGSNINIKVDAPSVSGEASSGAEINCEGKTKEVKGNSSSGSTVNFSELKAETANATASSGASISLFASVGIVANASSGGEITYKGGATSIQKNVSSGGSVNAE